MAAHKKCYYPWASWNKAVSDRGMQFLKVFFNRLDPTMVNRAVVSAPYTKREVVGGVRHILILRKDVYLHSDGTAYSKDGKPLKEFDLELSE